MTAERPASGRGPGRPRSEDADRAILRAAIDVLATRGAAGFTMDAVAKVAGVAKTTIYRRWSSKHGLLIDAVRAIAAAADPPDTGSARDDLVAMVTELVRVFSTTPAGDAARAIIGELSHNPELARVFRGIFLAERFAIAEAVLRRGMERGELGADADPHLLASLLIAPIFLRHIVTGEPLTADFATHVIDHVLAPARVSTPNDA